MEAVELGKGDILEGVFSSRKWVFQSGDGAVQTLDSHFQVKGLTCTCVCVCVREDAVRA